MPRDFNHGHFDARRWQRTELVYNKQFKVKRGPPYKLVALALVALVLVLWVLMPVILQALNLFSGV